MKKKDKEWKKCFICGDVINVDDGSKRFRIGNNLKGGLAHGDCIKQLASCLRWQILMIDLDINLKKENKYKKLGDDKLLIDVGDNEYE